MHSKFSVILKHLNKLNEYKSTINEQNYKSTLSSLYKYIKSIIPFYFEDNQTLPYYREIRQQIINIENMIEDETIIDTSTSFKTKPSFDTLLDKVIYQARRYLIEEYYGHPCDNEFMKNVLAERLKIDFANYCQLSAEYIQRQCEKNHIESTIVCITPAYNDEAQIYYGSGYHYINLVKYEGKNYLIDITYQQFFSARTNNLDRLGVAYLSGCDVGTFMLMNKEGHKIAKELIDKGYIELTEEVFKQYLDAFTISYRNGLYYENKKDFSFTTKYTYDDYIRFLANQDSQLNHEPREYLGYQTKPLKNSKLEFIRK